MGFLANFIMRGYSQAALVTTTSALLALIFPVIGIISSGALTLVSLQVGAKNALQVLIISVTASIFFTLITFNTALPVLMFVLLLWLPMLSLGFVLRISRSLSFTIQIGLAFGILLIAVLYLGLENPQLQWVQLLEPLLSDFNKTGLLDQPDNQTFLLVFSAWMSGILAAGFYLQLIISLLLARNWQAQLYNPGAFINEFANMRMHSSLAVITVLTFIIAYYQNLMTPVLVRDVALLLLPLWFIQGLAVIHGVILQTILHSMWVVVLYFILIILTVPAVTFVTFIGLVDVVFDFRGKLGSGTGSKP